MLVKRSLSVTQFIPRSASTPSLKRVSGRKRVPSPDAATPVLEPGRGHAGS